MSPACDDCGLPVDLDEPYVEVVTVDPEDGGPDNRRTTAYFHDTDEWPCFDQARDQGWST